MIKKPTITVAISAYNEEKNIRSFLKSVLNQKEDGFVLKEIWIYSDGSTDKTVTMAKSFHSKKISVVSDDKRLGKSSRLNTIYARLKTDILVQSDADIIMSHPFVIKDLIQPLLRRKKAGMCGGHMQPIPGKTFTEKAVNCTVEAYMPLRKMLHKGNNIFSVDGRLIAYKKELVKKIYIPEDMTSNDKFTYFCCLKFGYTYHYVPSAVILYRSPTCLRDQLRQEGRFSCSYYRHCRYFPKKLVARERYIPRSFRIKTTILQALRHPIMCGYIFLINFYCRSKARDYEKIITARWPMAISTKAVIKII